MSLFCLKSTFLSHSIFGLKTKTCQLVSFLLQIFVYIYSIHLTTQFGEMIKNWTFLWMLLVMHVTFWCHSTSLAGWNLSSNELTLSEFLPETFCNEALCENLANLSSVRLYPLWHWRCQSLGGLLKLHILFGIKQNKDLYLVVHQPQPWWDEGYFSWNSRTGEV